MLELNVISITGPLEAKPKEIVMKALKWVVVLGFLFSVSEGFSTMRTAKKNDNFSAQVKKELKAQKGHSTLACGNRTDVPRNADTNPVVASNGTSQRQDGKR